MKGLVKDLVRQKWDSFGRRMHITKRVLPSVSRDASRSGPLSLFVDVFNTHKGCING